MLFLDLPRATPWSLRFNVQPEEVAWVGDADGEFTMEVYAFFAALDELDDEEVLVNGIVVMLKGGAWWETAWGEHGFGWYLRSLPERGEEQMTVISGGGAVAAAQGEEPKAPIARLKAEIDDIKQQHTLPVEQREQLLLLRRSVLADPIVDSRTWDMGIDNREAQDLAVRLLELHIGEADERGRGRKDDYIMSGLLHGEMKRQRRLLPRAEYNAWLNDMLRRAMGADGDERLERIVRDELRAEAELEAAATAKNSQEVTE